MNSLPDELQLAIASYLDDRKDSANYRLTSTRFARVGAELYFKTLDFGCCLRDQSLERIRAVASSPFAKYVTGVSYDGAEEPPATPMSADFRLVYHHETLRQITREFSTVNLHLDSVQLHNFNFYYFTSAGYARFFTQACVAVKELGFFFRPLSRDLGRWDLQTAERNIGDCLGRLHDLEALSMTFHVSSDFVHQNRLCVLIPPARKWSSLRELSLYGVVCTAPGLVALLHNHAHTLKYLWLQSLKLADREVGLGELPELLTKEEKGEEWKKVLAQIGNMRLKHAYVTECRWPPAPYKERDSFVTTWILNGKDGHECVFHTNVVDDLDDVLDDDSDYDAEEGSEDDSEEYSDDSEFWPDEDEVW